jgi:hypothetical protein
VAGTYQFKLLDSPGNRNIILIYSADQTRLEDMVHGDIRPAAPRHRQNSDPIR